MIRFIGEKNPVRTVTEVEEALAVQTIASAQVGPRLIGVFKDGRIEEFIEGRLLTLIEANTPTYISLVARNLATIHSLDVPLRKESDYMESIFRKFICSSCETIRTSSINEIIESESVEVGKQLRTLASFDYLGYFDWILDKIRKIPTRVSFSHNDFYVNNIMLRTTNGECRKILTELDLATIDLEMCAYFYRGYDIGQFLHELSFDYLNTERPLITGRADEKLEALFIQEYLNKWKELNADKFDPNIDTVENVLLESRLLSLIVFAFFPNFIMLDIIKDPKNIPYGTLAFMAGRLVKDMDQKLLVQKMLNERNIV